MRRAATGTARYSGVAIAFHWSIAALIVTNLVIGLGHQHNEKWGSIPAHEAIGITVLVLSFGRVAWRLGHRPPPLPGDVTRLQTGAAHALHWTFYLLMLAMPISGWLMASADGKFPISWFGLFRIPFLPIRGETVATITDRMHLMLGWLFVPLILIHVSAALWHHFGQRDTVLLRMWPRTARTA